MRGLLRIACLAIIGTALTGCVWIGARHDPKEVFSTPDVYEFIDETVEIIRAKDADRLLARMHPDLRQSEEVRNNLSIFYDLLPAQEEIRFNHYHSQLRDISKVRDRLPLSNMPDRIYQAFFDVTGKDEIFIMRLDIIRQNGECCVLTFVAYAKADILPSSVGKFTLSGKGPFHYLFLIFLVVVPVYCIATAVACIRNKNVRFKWFWVPFILIGFWGFQINWASGEIKHLFSFEVERTAEMTKYTILRLQLLGVIVLNKGPLYPWYITIGIPLGAILYWWIPARAARVR